MAKARKGSVVEERWLCCLAKEYRRCDSCNWPICESHTTFIRGKFYCEGCKYNYLIEWDWYKNAK